MDHIYHWGAYCQHGHLQMSPCYLNTVLWPNYCLGVPVATDKLVRPTTTLVFLGIEVDSHNLQLCLPPDKLHHIQTLISSWQEKRSSKKWEIQSLLGHLNHASKIGKPGQSFLNWIIDLLPIATYPKHSPKCGISGNLLWWHVFIAGWN